MPNVNKVILIGHLGADPEIRYTATGKAVTNFSLATTEKWTSGDGEKKERTEWHKIVAWGKPAEVLGAYLKKGSAVYLEGSLQTRQWEDNEGTKRYTTEVNVRNFQFLSGGGKSQRPDVDDPGPVSIPEDDIPF